MENNEQRPSAALINREWFESACKVLSYEEQGALLVNAVEYVLNGTIRCKLSSKIAIVFEMIKPALDSDIAKYRERCARNAANAKSQWQRVAASGGESQRVAANTTTTPTPTTTPTQSLSESTDKQKEIEKDKWLVTGYFWSIGSRAVREEFTAFWSYYESLGWKNNKGAAIVSRISCARMWRRQYETGNAPAGAAEWFEAVKKCPIYDYGVWYCYRGAERVESGAVVRLACSEQFLADLRKAVPTLEKSLQGAWKVPAIEFRTA